MKKLKQFMLQMGLVRLSEKICFCATLLLLIGYTEFVVLAQNSIYGQGTAYLPVFYAILVVPLCLAGVIACGRIELFCRPRRGAAGWKELSLAVGGIVFEFTFLFYFLWQKAYWPGSYYPDSINQYYQAVTGAYENWHPVLHTWLFFWLPRQIFSEPAAGIITMQILWFSLAVAYLFAVLYQNGCSKLFLCLSWLYIIANPNTAYMVIYAWKDSAMSIFALVLFAQVLQIYMTKGEWLGKWRNVAAFSLSAFLTLEMRHNAVLLVAPVFVILFIVLRYFRKKVAVSALFVIIAAVILQGPVFALAKVASPGRRTTEIVGLPMTILCNVYQNDRDSLSADALRFMDSLAKPEEWEDYYAVGSFNSMKWNVSLDIQYRVEEEGLENILRYTYEAALNSPEAAWEGFAYLTHQVWGIDGGEGQSIDYRIADNDYGIRYHDGNELLNAKFTAYAQSSGRYATKYLFHYTGVMILLLLFMATAKLGNGRLARALMVLAPMAYDFGTMLLLSGPDFRFFHFNFLIVIPLLYLLGAGDPPADSGEETRDSIPV